MSVVGPSNFQVSFPILLSEDLSHGHFVIVGKKCCTLYDCEVLCCTMIVMSFRAKLIETTRDPFPRDLRLYEVNLSK